MLSNFPGCVPIIPRKMRLLPFSSNATKLLRHGECFSGHGSPFLLKQEERKEAPRVHLQVWTAYGALCDSFCAPKREGMFTKLLLCAKPLSGMILMKSLPIGNY